MCRTYLFSLRPGPARWRLGDTFLSIDKDDWGAGTQQVSDGFTARFTKGPRCRVQDVERYLFLLIEPCRSPTVLEIGPKLMIRMVHTHVLNGICYHINWCRMLSNLFCNCCFTSQGEEKAQKSEESVQRSVGASMLDNRHIQRLEF